MIMTWRNLFSIVPVGWFPMTENEDGGLVHLLQGVVLEGKNQERSFYSSLTLREGINGKEKL